MASRDGKLIEASSISFRRPRAIEILGCGSQTLVNLNAETYVLLDCHACFLGTCRIPGWFRSAVTAADGPIVVTTDRVIATIHPDSACVLSLDSRRA